MLRKTLFFTFVAVLLCALLIPPPAQAVRREGEPLFKVQNVDKMKEPQLKAFVDSYIKNTVKPQELAIRKKQNLLSHKVVAVKKLPNEIIKEFVHISDYERLGKPFLVLYAAVDYKVAEESKYRLNGINYRLLIMVKYNGGWGVADFNTAPVHTIVEKGQGFGTEDEKEMAKITELHYQGIYKNREGKTIGDLNTDNIATEANIRYEMTGEAVQTASGRDVIPGTVNANYKRPMYIRVLMTDPRNLKHYGCTKACVKRIEFFDYLKHVLPFEWEKDAHPEALKAGALTVKMYAWHAVTVDPKARYTDADVTDTTATQAYLANFNLLTARERKVVEKIGTLFHEPGVAGVAFKENLFDNLIYVEHKRSGTEKSGVVSQTGSNQLAKRGKNYIDILKYYVEDSPKTPKGAKVDFFRYAK